MFLGVGMIIGAGVFVSTGAAAANLAGPAVVISFVVGGVSSLLSALVYAEFAAEYPIAGGAFNYISLTFGELAAWCAARRAVCRRLALTVCCAAGCVCVALSLVIIVHQHHHNTGLITHAHTNVYTQNKTKRNKKTTGSSRRRSSWSTCSRRPPSRAPSRSTSRRSSAGRPTSSWCAIYIDIGATERSSDAIHWMMI